MDNEYNKKTLVKVLVDAACGSRRAMTQAIRDHRVKVNGEIAEAYTMPVDILKDEITLDNKVISNTETSYKYILLNKPIGYICSTDDPHNTETVLKLLPANCHNLHPAGRLDMDSHGLVIMTNDGDLTYRITHPRFNKDKEYKVRLDKPLTVEDRNNFENGVQLEDGLTAPAKVKILHVQAPFFLYSATIHEGKNRQIRRMFAALGYKVLDLERIRIGAVRLDNIESGKWRVMTKAELDSFK